MKYFLYLSYLLSLFSIISCCSNNLNETCLKIYMNSLTEDGWNDVKLFVEFPDGSVASDAPDAINNPIEREVCLDSSTSGVFYVTAAVEDPTVKPRNPWGVFWTVTICQGNTTQVFTGGYNTTFILSFDSNLREWALVYEENIKPNERVCSACESNECDADNNDNDPNKPNPKPRLRRRRRRDDDDDKKKRRKGNDDRKKRKPSGGKKSNDDDHNNNNNSTHRQLDHHTNTSVISAPTVSYEPYVDAKVSMFDEEGDGWWFNDYLGISWYLADATRTTLFYTGTLCNGTSGFCNICLADGDYTFRVSGIKSSFASWNFCGVRGSYGEELIFEVQDNECFPIALLDLSNPSPQTITYVFESKLEVCLKEEYLNLTDPRAIATITNTLNEVLGLNSSSVIIEAKSDDDNNNGPNKPNLPSPRRNGKNKRHSKNDNNNDNNNNNSTDVDEPEPEVIYTHTIKFTITVKVESDELHIDELLETYENLLAQKILNGTFVSTLISNSLVYGYLPFNWTSCAVSSEFNYVEAHFDSSLPFISSSILASDTHNQEVISSYDYSAITLFFGSALVGIIAFVGIISKGLKTYDTLSNTSEHDFESSSTHSTSSHGLLPFSQIDMDQSVSNPLGRNAAAEVQMGQVRDSL